MSKEQSNIVEYLVCVIGAFHQATIIHPSNIPIFLRNRACTNHIRKEMSKETFMIESLTRDVVALLMEERGLSMREAMDAFCRSRTFDALSKPETGLFFQSPAYILDEFKNEKSN